MRTTLTVSDELFEAAKHRARRRGMTFGDLVEASLRRELALDDASTERLPVPVFRGGSGPRAGVDLASNRALHEFLDETLEPDARR